MIYFIRHGESEANLMGVFAGQRVDSILTEKGKEQAKTTASIIKSRIPKIDKIISSPLKRTFETAEIIAREIGFNQDDIEIDTRITEYDMGSLSGTSNKKVSSAILTSAKHAENTDDFHNRVYSCVKELSKLPEIVLIVSHAGVGRMLETIKTNKEPRLFYDIARYPNGSVTKLDWIK